MKFYGLGLNEPADPLTLAAARRAADRLALLVVLAAAVVFGLAVWASDDSPCGDNCPVCRRAAGGGPQP